MANVKNEQITDSPVAYYLGEDKPRAGFADSGVRPWIYPVRGIAVRLFLTCWLVFGLHFATNIVREIYPAVALGDRLTFRLDEYANLHPDIFEKEGYGWHINNNPGVSLIAAIPYALSRVVIDPIVDYVNASRSESGLLEPPQYNSPWPMAQEFYRQVWQKGLDVKLGLAAMVMQMLVMAPSSALAAVLMFYVLRILFNSDRTALLLALLYAFGTPVFFRSGTLNQNLMLGHIAFLGFVVMWDMWDSQRLAASGRYFIGGLTGGMAVLFDYSGAVLLLGLFVYGLIKARRRGSWNDFVRSALWFVAGSLIPLSVLWFYQWRSFGNPFLPAQHWMAPVKYIEQGYQGFGLPQPDLLVKLLLDYRYGLFLSSPLMLLALFAPIANRKERRLPNLELYFILLLSLVFWLFSGGNNYTRLQFNTGFRHLAPLLPFLYMLVSVTLLRLPGVWIYVIGTLSIAQAWSMAMYRDVERGLGVLDPLLSTFIGGFQLPLLSSLSRLEGSISRFYPNGVSPLPLFVLVGVLLFILWNPKLWKMGSRLS